MKLLIGLAVIVLVVSSVEGGSVSPSLQRRLDEGESLDISIYLPSISSVFNSSDVLELKGEARVQRMITELKKETSAAQRPFLDQLSLRRKSQADVRTLWVTNFIRVKKADKDLVADLAGLPGDFLIREPIVASVISPVSTRKVTDTEKGQGLQWGVQKIDTQRAWNVTRGAGVVVGIIDAGVSLGHEALRDNYGGAWVDPYMQTDYPDDYTGHGTHVLGIAVGTKNGIGVAPEAKWIACRGLSAFGSGYDDILLYCAQWMLTITPRPNIVINSWGGKEDNPWFNDAAAAWRMANIIPVFSIGNDGPECNSVHSPGDQEGVISVGATDSDDVMADFSSRGPSNSGVQKPDVSAPGVEIVSAGHPELDLYVAHSGTSVATPFVAGAIALYISENPGVTYEEVYERFTSTGDRPALSDIDRTCGNSEWPNMAFGFGRINAGNAIGA